MPRFGPCGTVSSGSQVRRGEAGTERKECVQVFSPTSESPSEITLLAGVAGQLKLNSFGIVSGETERLWRNNSGYLIALRPRCSFCFLNSFSSTLLAAIRISSISSVLKRFETLEARESTLRPIRDRRESTLLPMRECRESTLLPIRERTELGGMLIAMSELGESQLSSCLGVRRPRAFGVTIQLFRDVVDRAGEADTCRDPSREDAREWRTLPGRNVLGQAEACSSAASKRGRDILRGRCAVRRFGPRGVVSSLLLVRRPHERIEE